MLKDDILLYIIKFLDLDSVLNLMAVSKLLYRFCQVEDLWLGLYMEEREGVLQKVKRLYESIEGVDFDCYCCYFSS